MANEKRLIDANALEYHKFCYMSANDAYRLGWNEAISAVMENAPTVDAVEVIHGEWVRNEDDECYWYTCSECAEYPMRDRWGEEKLTDYCPYCGAKMDGDGNGNLLFADMEEIIDA